MHSQRALLSSTSTSSAPTIDTISLPDSRPAATTAPQQETNTIATTTKHTYKKTTRIPYHYIFQLTFFILLTGLLILFTYYESGEEIVPEKSDAGG